VATKIIIPLDPTDLRAGGHSLFVEQRGYADTLRTANLEGSLRRGFQCTF
jgi:hypothetical protein